MTTSERILKRAKHKVRQHLRREYVIHGTPTDILALVKAGILPTNHREYWKRQVEYAQERKAMGDSRPTWFYFQLGKLTLDQ